MYARPARQAATQIGFVGVINSRHIQSTRRNRTGSAGSRKLEKVLRLASEMLAEAAMKVGLGGG
jgi:hypothetical protein